MTSRLTAPAAVLAFALAAACGSSGGSSTSPTPAPAPALPLSSACGTLTQSAAAAVAHTDIVNGADCPVNATAPVVLLNLKNADGQVGSCSGTIISSRAVLTAAHCLQGVTSVLMFLGTGPERPSSAISAHPSWNASNPSNFDVGIVQFASDIGVAPKPLLLGRDVQVGETAVIAGWGKSSATGATATLRAGVATIIGVTSLTLQTTSTTTASSVCQGDSGGPIMVQEGNTWAIGGVISANSTLACSFGDNLYAAVRASSNQSFILGLVPDAARK